MAKRNGSPGGALDPALSQKKRARRRLIGAAAVALAAAIALPLLLDSEPRQQFPEVEVEIPSRDMPLRPLPSEIARSGEAATRSGAASGATPGDPAGNTASPSPSSPPATPAPAEAQSAKPPVAAPAPPAPAPGAPKKPAPKPAAASKPDAGQASAKPLGEVAKPASEPAKSAAPAATSSIDPGNDIAALQSEAERRFGLQVGAYANPDSAKTMAARARKAGVRAYTETIETAEGLRTRVRIGPFANRDAAERGRGKLKLVGIDSTVVSLQP